MLGYTFDTLGARKRGKKRSKKRSRKSAGGCHTGVVRFKTKRGKVVQFRGKTGAGCAPRKKPSTRHLAPYKKALSRAAKACRGKSGGQFRRCVAAKM